MREFDKYDINDKYDCFTMYRHLIGSVSDKTHTMREILVIIAFLLVFISFFTISSFVNISISERTYEIGILRALGCNKKDIKRYFLYTKSYNRLHWCSNVSWHFLYIKIIYR